MRVPIQRARNRVADAVRLRSDRGEVASWLIVAAFLTAAAAAAAGPITGMIASLTDQIVAAGASTPAGPSGGSTDGGGAGSVAASGPATSPGNGEPIPPLAPGETVELANGDTVERVRLDSGEEAILRTSIDGQQLLIIPGADGDAQVIAVNSEGDSIVGQIVGFAEDAYNDATSWHFEDRDELNGDVPQNLDGIQDGVDGWTLLPEGMSIYHDDPATEDPELKFVHEDGREAVYNPETGELVTDPRYAGTYNYVVPELPPEDWWNVPGWGSWAGSNIGHFVTDVLPYWFGGNVRGDDPTAPPPDQGGDDDDGGGTDFDDDDFEDDFDWDGGGDDDNDFDDPSDFEDDTDDDFEDDFDWDGGGDDDNDFDDPSDFEDDTDTDTDTEDDEDDDEFDDGD